MKCISQKITARCLCILFLCPSQELRAHSSWTGTCPSAETPPTFLMEKKHLDGQRGFLWRWNSGVSLFAVAGYQPAQLHKSQWHLEHPSQELLPGSYWWEFPQNPLVSSCLVRNEDLQYTKTLKVFFTSFTAVFSHHTFWTEQMKPSRLSQDHEAVPSSPQGPQSILNTGATFTEAVPGGNTPKLLCTSGNSKTFPLIPSPLPWGQHRTRGFHYLHQHQRSFPDKNNH